MSEAQKVNVSCPNCNQAYDVPAATVGRKVRCRLCGYEFRASANGDAAAQSDADDASPLADVFREEFAARAEEQQKKQPQKTEGQIRFANEPRAAEEMIRCPKCGGKMPPRATLCIRCGHDLEPRSSGPRYVPRAIAPETQRLVRSGEITLGTVLASPFGGTQIGISMGVVFAAMGFALLGSGLQAFFQILALETGTLGLLWIGLIIGIVIGLWELAWIGRQLLAIMAQTASGKTYASGEISIIMALVYWLANGVIGFGPGIAVIALGFLTPEPLAMLAVGGLLLLPGTFYIYMGLAVSAAEQTVNPVKAVRCIFDQFGTYVLAWLLNIVMAVAVLGLVGVVIFFIVGAIGVAGAASGMQGSEAIFLGAVVGIMVSMAVHGAVAWIFASASAMAGLVYVKSQGISQAR